MTGSPWSKSEMRILSCTAGEGIAFLREQLPRRTTPAIRQRARLLNIKLGPSKRGDRAEHQRGRVALPSHCHPLVRSFFVAVNDEQAFLHEVATKSGVARATLSDWRRKVPRIDNFDAALNSIGLKLAIVPAEGRP